MKKCLKSLGIRDLQLYTKLFVRACDHFHISTNEKGEYILTKGQKERVNRFIRLNW